LLLQIDELEKEGKQVDIRLLDGNLKEEAYFEDI